MTWCATPRVVGTVHFGTRPVQDAQTLLRLYALANHPDLSPPLRRVVDGRWFASVDEDAWSALAPVAERAEQLRSLFERQAIIVPSGLRGAQLAALLGALGPGDAFRPFTSSTEAYAWAVGADGARIERRVDALMAPILADAAAARVRGWIASHLADADLGRCARALGMSVRTLQRSLGREGQSFRTLAAHERVRTATTLLASPHAKVETVAQQVGAASASHLAQLLKRAGHPPPSAWRRPG